MATVTASQIYGGLADLGVTFFEANKTGVEALITTGEVDLQAAIANALKNLPKPGGFEGVIVGQLETQFETQIESYAATLVQKYGADALYALIDAELKAWAKDLGG